MVFKTKAFKDWLDELCRVAIKTRDGFTCQIGRPGCSGAMSPDDKNCDWHHIIPRSEGGLIFKWSLCNSITSCRNCHTWVHEHRKLTKIWFASSYPLRNALIEGMHKYSVRTWRRGDYEKVEGCLIRAATQWNVDYLNIKPEHRAKFKRKVEEILCES